MKRIVLLAATMAISLAAMAQSSGQVRPDNRNDQRQPSARPSVEQEAQMRVEQMAAEFPLTQKQVKKLLKFYKKDIQYRRDNFQMHGGPRPDGGQRPGNNGQRGPEMGREQRPHGNPGMGAGNGHRPGMEAGTPPSRRPDNQNVDFEEIEKYNLKQDKKLRKIIGDDNFTRWRASHPNEMPQLPQLN